LTDDGLAALPGLSRLGSLHLNGGDSISDNGLKHVAGMTGLGELVLSASRITDGGLAHLSNLDQLGTLRIGFPQVTDDGFRHIAGLWRLNALELGNANVTGAGLKHLTKLGQLTSLFLLNCPVTDEGLKTIVGLESLQELQLNQTKVTNASVDTLKKLTKLKKLYLNDSPVSNTGRLELKKALPECEVFPEPKSDPDPDRAAAEWVLMRAGRVHIAEEGKPAVEIGKLADLPRGPFRLTTVWLGGPVPFTGTDAEFKCLEGLRSLVSVGLVGCPVGDDALGLIAKVPNLNSLQLDGTRVTDIGVRRLGPVNNLANLQLSSTAVTGTGFVDWRDAPMQNLTVGNVTDDGLRAISSFSKLRVLAIGGNNVTDEGMKALRTTNVAELSVTSTGITNATLDSLLEMKDLKRLLLTGTNGMTADAIKKVAKLPKLNDLGLAGDWVTDDGLAHLRGTRIQALSLWPAAPRVTNAGVKHLREIKTLREIGLQGAAVTDECIPDLLAIKPATLHLNGTKVSNAGLLRLKAELPGCDLQPQPR
jgi:Leucine-rich repeat (LRR) protein